MHMHMNTHTNIQLLQIIFKISLCKCHSYFAVLHGTSRFGLLRWKCLLEIRKGFNFFFKYIYIFTASQSWGFCLNTRILDLKPQDTHHHNKNIRGYAGSQNNGHIYPKCIQWNICCVNLLNSQSLQKILWPLFFFFPGERKIKSERYLWNCYIIQ